MCLISATVQVLVHQVLKNAMLITITSLLDKKKKINKALYFLTTFTVLKEKKKNTITYFEHQKKEKEKSEPKTLHFPSPYPKLHDSYNSMVNGRFATVKKKTQQKVHN